MYVLTRDLVQFRFYYGCDNKEGMNEESETKMEHSMQSNDATFHGKMPLIPMTRSIQH